MPRINNPVGRLHVLALEIQNTSANSAREGWAKIFSTDPKNTSEILKGLADIYMEIRDAIRVVHDANEDEDLYLQPILAVRAALETINLDEPWPNVRSRFQQNFVFALAYCADVIGRTHNEKVVEEEVLSTVQSEVEALVQRVVELDTDPELRRVIVDALNGIRAAIIDYRIVGSRGVNDAVDKAVGAVIRNRWRMSTNEDRDVFRAVFEWLARADTIFSITNNAHQLLPAATELFKALPG